MSVDDNERTDTIYTWLVHEAGEDIDCNILETLAECFTELTTKQIDSVCKVMKFLETNKIE